MTAKRAPKVDTHVIDMPTQLPLVEWEALGVSRFGADRMTWRFICPSCRHVASVAEWKAVSAPESTVAYSCIGRWLGATDANTFQARGGPCNYAGGGLFGLNPIHVTDALGKVHHVFAFAPAVREP